MAGRPQDGADDDQGESPGVVDAEERPLVRLHA
jgi:hypothetical protein